MTIIYTSGNLLDYEANVYINTVNCVGVMGKGLALCFKQKFPEMFENYKQFCLSGMMRPGVFHFWKIDKTHCIINFPTKRHWKNSSLIEDIILGLQALKNYLSFLPKATKVALPALGCGYGGLNWEEVKLLIERYLSDLEIKIYCFPPASSK